MLWDITGALRESGEDATMQVEAETRDSAIRRAGRAGMLVRSAEPAEIDFAEPAPTISYASAPAYESAVAPPTFLPYASQSTGRPIGMPPSGLGIASLVMGCVAVLVLIVPCVNILSIPLAILGLTFGIISWVNAAKYKRHGIGFPIAGTSVSAFAMLILIGLAIVVVVAISAAPTTPIAATPIAPAPVTPFAASANSIWTQQQQIQAAQQQANLAMQQSQMAQQQAAAQQRMIRQQQMLQQQLQQMQQRQPVQPMQPFQPPQPPRVPGHPF